MLNLPVLFTPLRTYLHGQTSFWMEVICLQHLLIEYLEQYNFLKIADANSIFADVKSITQLSHQHFFADVKYFELERPSSCTVPSYSRLHYLQSWTYFETFWYFKNLSFQHKWNKAQILVINMVYTIASWVAEGLKA